MKNGIKYFALTLSAFVVGMAFNGYAISNVPSKIAVVDVQKVVAKSSEVKKLKADREKKIQDLSAFIKTAKETVAKESDAKKRKALEDKYNKELNTKRNAIQKDYTTKLTAIDKNISAIIAKKAQAAQYDIVLAKGVVLYGGTDITAEITKEIK